MKKLFFVVILCGAASLIWSGCQKQIDLEQVRAAIEETNTKFAEAVNSGDLEALAAFYTEDATMMPPNAEPVSGREAIKEFLGDFLGMGISNFSLKTDRVDGAPGLVYEVGSYSLEMGAIKDEGKYVVIWKQDEAGAWKLHVDMFSSNKPLPEMEGTN